jgi:uncharacterized protein YndB with AHSA1/START domain
VTAPAPAGDRARVTTYVAAAPERAFAVFTGETDLWWRRGPRFRFGGARRGTLSFEPGAGGRLFEAFSDAPADVFEVGKILVWEPGARLVFEWRLTNFAPGERTEVEILFEPTGEGTRVTLEHRGWSALRADHPARHGLPPSEHVARVGTWWGELLLCMRGHAAGD